MSAHREVPVEFYRGAKISLLTTSGDFKAESGVMVPTLKAQTLVALRAKIDASVPEGLIADPFPALTMTYSIHEASVPVKVLGVRNGAKGPLIIYEKPDGSEGLAEALLRPTPELDAAIAARAAAFAESQLVDARWRDAAKKVEEVQRGLKFGATDVAGIAMRNSEGGQTP